MLQLEDANVVNSNLNMAARLSPIMVYFSHITPLPSILTGEA